MLMIKLASYPFVKRTDSYYYEFFSEGPKGRIKKVVEFSRLHGIGDEIFNLAFGDWNEESQRISDLSISNNTDREKVLATVAMAIINFMKDHPGAIIIAMGSTRSRTRLYQMGISKILGDISQKFEIQGYIKNSWQPFVKGVNYNAFLLKAK